MVWWMLAGLLGAALAGYGAQKAGQVAPTVYPTGGMPGYGVAEPLPTYGVPAPGVAGKGTLGGVVIARGRQMMMIQTPDGRRILVKTQKRRKAPQRRPTGTKMDKLLELAVISSMFRKG